VPTWIASGAGAAGFRAIGTMVLGGAVFATLWGGPFVPVLFCVAQWIEEACASRDESPVDARRSPFG
jgi:hypothetical protein